jgi:hypothetical protein
MPGSAPSRHLRIDAAASLLVAVVLGVFHPLHLGAQVAGKFPDVDASTPYASDIATVAGRGIMTGYADGRFGPGDTLNRAQLVTLLGRATLPPDAVSTCGALSFRDTDATAWYARYVCAAQTYGIVKGYPDGTFRPDAPISVGEAGKVLALSFHLPITTQVTSPELWYYPYANALAAHGAMPDSYRTVDQTVTRAEVAFQVRALTDAAGNRQDAAPSVSSEAGVSTVDPTLEQALLESQMSLSEALRNSQAYRDSHAAAPTVSGTPEDGPAADGSGNGDTQVLSPQQAAQCDALECALPPSGCVYVNVVRDGAGCPVSCGSLQCAPVSSRPASSAASSAAYPTAQCTVSHADGNSPLLGGLSINADGSKISFVAEGSGQPYYVTGAEYKPQVFVYDARASLLSERTSPYSPAAMPTAGRSATLSGNGQVLVFSANYVGWTYLTVYDAETNRYEQLGEFGADQVSDDGRIVGIASLGCVVIYDRQTRVFTNLIGDSSYCMNKIRYPDRTHPSAAWEPRVTGNVYGFVLSADGRTVAANIMNNQGNYVLKVVDVASGTVRASISNAVSRFLSADGGTLVYGATTGSVVSWVVRDLATGTVVPFGTVNGKAAALPDIIVRGMSADADRFLIDDYAGHRTLLYDRSAGVSTTIYSFGDFGPPAAVLSADGRTVAYAEPYTAGVSVWHADTGQTSAVPETYSCPLDTR